MKRAAMNPHRSGSVAEEAMAALAEAADLARTWAPEQCSPAHGGGPGCSWYHTAWPTLRLLGTVSGAKGDEDFFQECLKLNHHDQASHRILVAGAADHGLLEQVAMAYQTARTPPEVTVVDQCNTPLLLNRWYARRVGLRLQVHLADMLNFRHASPFDVLVAHSIFSFIPEHQHATLMTAWRQSLKTGGLVVMSQVVRQSASGPKVRRFSAEEVEAFVSRVRADARGMALPKHLPESELLALAGAFATHKETHVVYGVESLLQLLAQSGFTLERLDCAGRANTGHRSASPDSADALVSARVVARAA